jgi:hypothetical protein
MLACLALVWSLTGLHAAGQPTNPPSTLGAALERLATTAEVSLVYDADLVRGYDANCAVDGAVPEKTLRCLLGETDLDFVQTSGGTYVVRPDVRRPPQRGTVRGIIRDVDTNAPLSQAHVRLAEGKGGVVANEDGRFWLSGLVSGPHTLVVSHLGYETARVAVTVPPGDTTRSIVGLSPSPITADPVVVDAPTAAHLPPGRTHATLSPEQLAQPAATGTPSVAHAAGTLMGITTQAPYADLHVQGSASSAHEVRLDGVPVRNPASAGRLLGALSPLALDGLAARKAGFGVLRGDVLSGIIDTKHDLQRPGVRYGTAQIDPVSVNGRVEGTVDLDGTTATVMGAGRMGVWDLYRSQALSRLIDTWSVLDPVLTAAQLATDSLGTLRNRQARPRSEFYDLHGAARFALTPTRHLFVSAYRGHSALGADLVVGPENATSGLDSEDPPPPDEPASDVAVPSSDRYEWTNTVAQARYDAHLSDQATGTLQASLSRYRATSTYEVEPLSSLDDGSVLAQFAHSSVEGSRTSNAVTDLGLDGTLDLSFAGRHALTLSAGLTWMNTEVRLANAFTGLFRHADRAARVTAAGQARVAVGPFTTLLGGLRTTALPERRAVFVEPRGAVRYHRPRTALGEVAVRVGGGLYRQYTTQFEMSRDGATAVVPTAQVWMPLPANVTPPRTYHLATNVTWRPTPSWTVGLEGYAKWQPHLLSVDYPALQSTPPLNPSSPSTVLSASRGRTVGGGVEVSYEGDWGTGTLRYTYTRARRTFPGRFDGRMVPPPWTDPHRLTLNGRVPLTDVFALDLRGTGVWNRPWGFRRAYYAYLASDEPDASLPDFHRPAAHVLPPLYRVDAGLVATHSWENVEVTGRVGLVNVLGRANVADWGLRPSGADAAIRWPRTLPGRRSVASLQIQF